MWLPCASFFSDNVFFNGFWLNRNVAFNRSALRSRVSQLFRYAVSVAGSLLLNYLLIKLFVEVCRIYATPSMLLTSAVCTVYELSYVQILYVQGAGRRLTDS
ncbi:MAG: GtrA family protein [Alistipes putredinis]|nr:MAG: GtrA family protein [Alistipes putredinis]